ncbi:hypothetical protein Q8F57_026320 [Paraburkholderia terrae]|uniref:hypothetical protein n=1 Tax=Paraburkholderia terrae TaxID=311230 RepID=UPI00296B4454|nr:hypothetical protein [Paraburkholderia terrae]MDW3661302.1 hypothetical protein [Paraburkholderia terrae]
MQQESYRGYAIWGHAIAQQEELLARERYASSGTVTKSGKFVEASGILGVVDSESEAEHLGLEWARAWVDNHI